MLQDVRAKAGLHAHNRMIILVPTKSTQGVSMMLVKRSGYIGGGQASSPWPMSPASCSSLDPVLALLPLSSLELVPSLRNAFPFF
jgi:hypothetical protein